jgi:hypothetical protein
MRYAAVLLVLGSLLGGCAASVKRTLPDSIRTVAIGRFENMTDQGLLPSLLDEELRQAFRLDGRVAVADDPAGADAVLDGSIAAYLRTPARFDANNVVQEYRVRVTIEAKLMDRGSHESLWTDRGAKPASPDALAAGAAGAAGVAAVAGTPHAPKGLAVRRLDQETNFVVVPAAGLPVETEEDAQRRIVRDLANGLVISVLEGW